MTIDVWIERHARFNPHKPALHFNNLTITYRQLAQAVDETAAALSSSLKLQRGERIAIYAANHPYYFILLFAAARIGVILVPINWRLAVEEVRYIVDDCAPRVLFFSAQFRDSMATITHGRTDVACIGIDCDMPPYPAVDALRGAVTSGHPQTTQPAAPADSIRWPSEDDEALAHPLLIVYTSGTTGRPKGAVLSQKAIVCNARMSQHAYDITARDHVLNILPLFHVGGLNIQPLPALSMGATVTIHEKFDPAMTLSTIAASSITLITVVPTILNALLSSPQWLESNISSLRSIAIGSTDVPVDLIERAHCSGIPVVQIYGATESAPIAIYQRREDAFTKAGSIGRCGLCCEIRLVGDNGEDVDTGRQGEIWIRGDNILDAYWNNPKATRDNLSDGWFRSGDIARVDDNGDYWFVDRIKHVIISGGENIYPAELERVLNQVRGIREAAVVGRPDPRWGKVPVAVVVKSSDQLTRENVIDAFAGKLAPFKIPRDVIFVNALPRNALGKIIADELVGLV